MNLPTKITVVRLALIPVLILSYVLQSSINIYFCILTAGIFAIASATDFVDGYLARKYNLVTDIGKFLDPIADKILVLAGLLIVHDYGVIKVKYFMMIVILLIISRELIIGLFRQIAASKNVVLAADKLGKAKTVSTMFALTALLICPAFSVSGIEAINMICLIVYYWGIIWLLIATVLTVVSGINYIAKNAQVFKSNKVEVIEEDTQDNSANTESKE